MNRSEALRQAKSEIGEEMCSPSLDDVSECWQIAGRECKPVSAGLLVVLERVGHVMAGGSSRGTLVDQTMLLYALLGPPPAELVRLAADPEQFISAATEWAFTLTTGDIERMALDAVSLCARHLPQSQSDDSHAQKKTGVPAMLRHSVKRR